MRSFNVSSVYVKNLLGSDDDDDDRRPAPGSSQNAGRPIAPSSRLPFQSPSHPAQSRQGVSQLGQRPQEKRYRETEPIYIDDDEPIRQKYRPEQQASRAQDFRQSSQPVARPSLLNRVESFLDSKTAMPDFGGSASGPKARVSQVAPAAGKPVVVRADPERVQERVDSAKFKSVARREEASVDRVDSWQARERVDTSQSQALVRRRVPSPDVVSSRFAPAPGMHGMAVSYDEFARLKNECHDFMSKATSVLKTHAENIGQTRAVLKRTMRASDYDAPEVCTAADLDDYLFGSRHKTITDHVRDSDATPYRRQALDDYARDSLNAGAPDDDNATQADSVGSKSPAFDYPMRVSRGKGRAATPETPREEPVCPSFEKPRGGDADGDLDPSRGMEGAGGADLEDGIRTGMSSPVLRRDRAEDPAKAGPVSKDPAPMEGAFSGEGGSKRASGKNKKNDGSREYTEEELADAEFMSHDRMSDEEFSSFMKSLPDGCVNVIRYKSSKDAFSKFLSNYDNFVRYGKDWTKMYIAAYEVARLSDEQAEVRARQMRVQRASEECVVVSGPSGGAKGSWSTGPEPVTKLVDPPPRELSAELKYFDSGKVNCVYPKSQVQEMYGLMAADRDIVVFGTSRILNMAAVVQESTGSKTKKSGNLLVGREGAKTLSSAGQIGYLKNSKYFGYVTFALEKVEEDRVGSSTIRHNPFKEAKKPDLEAFSKWKATYYGFPPENDWDGKVDWNAYP